MNDDPLKLFLILAAMSAVLGWPDAAFVVGPITLEYLIRRVLPRIWRSVRARQDGFRYLPPLEQALRRGSRGFALMVFAVLAAVVPHVWFFGWRDFAGITSRPIEFWPLLACGGLFVAGAVGFAWGARRSLGAHDGVLWFRAAVCGGACVAALVYLVRVDLPARIEPPLGGFIFAALFAAALWFALVGFMRAALLSWPRGWALGRVRGYIEDSEFKWDGEERRRRWFSQSKGYTQ
jgi:hypothetical protein